MSEIAIPTTTEINLPAEGWHNSVITEVFGFSQYEDKNGKQIKDEDLDSHIGPKKLQNKLKVVFELDETDEQGIPVTVKSKPMNQTLAQKAALREFLNMIDPKILRDNKIFKPEHIIGRNCRIKLEHYTSPTNGKTYPNIKMIDASDDDNGDIPPFKR